MNLHQLAQHWLVHSLGFTLLHFCWQGVVIAAVLWCALQLLNARSAQTRYLVTCAALGLMVLLPLATFTRVALTEYHLAATTGLITAPSLIVQAGAGEASASWLARLDPALPWILLAYVVGCVIFLFRLSVGFSITRRMRFIAVSPAAVELQAAFATLQHRLGIPRAVSLMHSALVQVPTVIGWLRPVVLLPIGCFAGLSAMQVEAILAHELAHIRRHDYLVSVFQSIVEALLFYHPAVWWVSQQIRRERECCCDDLAVTITGDALAYARALSALEAKRSTYPQVVLGANGGVLIMRIKRLLRSNENASASQAAAVVVLALLVVGAVAIADTAHAQAASAPPAAPAAPPMPPAPPAMIAALPPVAPLPPLPPAAVKPATAAAPAAPALPPLPPAPPLSPMWQQQSGPIRVAGGVAAGQIVSKVNPVYPDMAKAAHISGAVVLKAIISKTGDIDSLQVVSGPPELVMSAMEAVRQWKYKPYLLNNEPTEVETTITVNYHFGGEDYTPPSPPPTAQNDGPDASGVVARPVGGSVTAPVLISSVDPEYTPVARANKINGQVMLHFWVDQQGRPTHIQVVRGAGYGLDEKAVEAVSQYHFKPGMENGKPVVVSLNTEINFQIF